MGFLDITFIEDEAKLNECVRTFNTLCEQGLYPDLLEYTHYDLAKCSNLGNPNLWKEFLLNPKIKEWYQTERQILLTSEVQKLIRTASKSGSTATVQTLNTLLGQLKTMEGASNNQKIIVYNFIPLTEEERRNPLIHEPNAIPPGIRRAVRIVVNEGTNNNKK